MENYDKYSIYIHIPFCKARCGYCAFCSCTDFTLADKYFSVLCDEMNRHADKTRAIYTVFLGGGTPSCVDEKYIDLVFDSLAKYFDVSNCREITIECNPESLTISKLDCFKANGVNRISIGLQSANDNTLKKIGRLHNYNDFIKAITVANQKGFCNINADLMIGLPESNESFMATVQKVSQLPLTHLSLYALEVHNNLPIAKVMADSHIVQNDDRLADLYDSARDVLLKKGFARYEVSNFAKQGYSCLHNIHYWQEGRYYGFGASAHGFVRDMRYSNADTIEKYIAEGGRGYASKEIISLSEEMYEYTMLALRLSDGVNLQQFQKRFGSDFFLQFPAAATLIDKGFLSIQQDRVFVPDNKFYVLNSILTELL